jgi:HK97 family phage major capsid protein
MYSKHSLMVGAALASSALVASLNFARFDGSDATIESIQKEIKSFGTDFKSLRDSMNKDIAELKSRVEDTTIKNLVDPLVKKQIEDMTASVATKHEALEKSIKSLTEGMDSLETAFKRSPNGSPGSDDEKKTLASALRHFETKMAQRGVLSPGNRPTIDKLDPAEVKAYAEWESKYFGDYLRVNDERSIEAKALSVGSNPDGGYLVPTARSAMIIQKIFETSPMRALAGIETIGTSELEIPLDLDEAAAGWVGETQSRTTTNTPTVGVQKIPVFELYAKPKATQKFLEDASIDVEAWLAGKVADKFGRIEATAFISGDGVGKPRGILSFTFTSTPGNLGRQTPLQMVSGASAAITADAIVALPFQLKQPYLAGASWLMKRSTVQAAMLLKDTTNQYLWRPSLTAGAPSILGGYEVNMADDMPAVAASALAVAFGNWKRAYLIVDRLGITTLRDPFSAKPFVEFYTRKRVGGDVVDFDAYVAMVIST